MNKHAKPPTQRNAEDIQSLKGEVSAIAEGQNTLIDAVSTLTDAIKELKTKPAANTEQRPYTAKDHPVVPNKYTDVRDMEMGGETGAAGFDNVPGEQVLKRQYDFETKANVDQEWAANMLADQEMVTVHIEEAGDEQADQIFEISVNAGTPKGETVFFRRGETKPVPRYIVEQLARSRPVTYRNEEYVDPNDGLRKNRYPAMKGLRYPFHIVNATPRDEKWLRNIMAQP